MSKIMILTSVHQADDVRIYRKEALSFRKAGYDVALLSPFRAGTDLNGVHFLQGKSYPNRISRLLGSARAYAKQALETDADIYVFHDPELLPAGMFLKRKGKKVVYDVHEDLPRQILSKPWIAPGLRKQASSLLERYENRCARRFDLIVTATPTIKKRFLHQNRNTITICNFPMVSEFLKIDTNAPREKIACYLGGITKIRGALQMVDAAAYLKGTLVLGGRYDGESLREQLQQRKGFEKTRYMGFLSRQQVTQLLARASVGLVILQPIPNYLVSLPIKMFEYMAAGLPVVASDFPYWRAMLEDAGCAVFVDPDSPEEIAGAVNELLCDPTKARQMGERGRKLVLERYNWEEAD